MIRFFSHSKTNIDGKKYGSKELRTHTFSVRSIALKSLYNRLNFRPEANIVSLIDQICLYHDFGKYNLHFFRYLLGLPEFDKELKQHAKLGGFVLYQKLISSGLEREAIIAAYVIFRHHSDLIPIGTLKEYVKDFSRDQSIFDKQVDTIRVYLDQISEEIEDPDLKKYLTYPDEKFVRIVRKIQKDPDIQHYFLINYLFSLLIEADKLDASDTKEYNRLPLPPDLVDRRIGSVQADPAKGRILKGLNQNELRAFVRASVLRHLDDPDIVKQLLFTLTAPTGIGKTLTALDFALRLKQIIREKEGYEPQIIYALPFINIIEQAIKEYERVIGSHGRVLAHYQFADAFEQLTKGKKAEDDENSEYHQQTMLLDTWQSDVVITTFVQFLQTLIGNRNKLLKKFHHFAGAIIILDEVQTIRLDHLPLVGAALYYLSKFLNTRVILMTATKPKTFDLANREIIETQKAGDLAQPLELLAGYREVFAAFQRTKIVPLIDRPIQDERMFVKDYFSNYWGHDRSCLIVCNIVKRSVDVFREIKRFNEEKGLENPVYYLSTNIIPCHRLAIIEQIKRDLQGGLKPVLISTQAIEAGVDLDFDMGFRDLGPFDSIIQVAGRINRENTTDRRNSPLYIVDFGDCGKVYGSFTTEQARSALEQGIATFGPEIGEEYYLQMIEFYYDSLSAEDSTSFFESRQFFNSMKTLHYDDEDSNTFPVSRYQVIEKRGGISSVFIEIDSIATESKQAFLGLIAGDLTKENFDKNHKLNFHQRIISVPDYLPKMEDLKLSSRYVLSEGLYLVPSDEINDFYDIVTGFDRSNEPVYEALTAIL